jgi:uncharacterized protein YycO
MRAAASHAGLHDQTACRRAIAAAYRDFEGSDISEDPLWAHFVTRSELDGLRGHALDVLGNHGEAAEVFSAIANHPDERYRRNSAYYSARLAAALADQGKIAEASLQACRVVANARDLQSNRVVSIMRDVKRAVEPYQSQVAEVREYMSLCHEALIA